MDGAANVTACDLFDPHQKNVLCGLRGGAGAICLIFTIIALLLFICIPPCKNFRRRIILILTVSTFFYLIFFILQISAIWKVPIGEDHHKGLCQAIGFCIQYFGWQELLLVSLIAVYLYYYYARFTDIFGPRRTGEEVPIKAKAGEMILYLTLILVPILPAGLGFINDSYGEIRGWCWIRSLDSNCKPYVVGIVLQVILWYFWCLICWIVTLVLFTKIVYKMRSNANEHSGRADRLAEDFRRKEGEAKLLLIYLGIFLVVNVIEFVGAIISYVISDNLYVWWGIYAVLSPLSAAAIPIGFLVVICCCYHREIRSPCSKCNRNHSDDDELLLTPQPATPN